MRKILTLILISFGSFASYGQQDSTQFEQVRSLLNFYEYMLNAVGSEGSSTRDKEVIIQESYKKIFESNDVQIEDDLLEKRSVITNKDVNAYLRDVDFFFEDITFDFQNEKIEQVYNEDSSGYFLVSFESAIEATTLEGGSYSKKQPRFMEVNYNAESEDLKIASIYSTKISREAELRNWWVDLSYGWKNLFQQYVPFDSLNSEALLRIADLDSISLYGVGIFNSLTPLLALKELKTLDISNTPIDNLEPLRHAKNLKLLQAKNTKIKNLSGLQYLTQLTLLDLSENTFESLSPLEELTSLRYLNLSKSSVDSFESLRNLNNLDSINLSKTAFSEVSILDGNKNLKSIRLNESAIFTTEGFQVLENLNSVDLSDTEISTLTGFTKHPNLQILKINGTNVSNLNPLSEAPNLQKVYADFSQVTEKSARDLMAKKSSVVVITNSKEIIDWWTDLPANWKLYFQQNYQIQSPTREGLIKFLNIDSLDVSKGNFYDPAPLQKFKRLKYLNVDQNLFTNFDFTSGMDDLEILHANKLPVESTEGLSENENLKELHLRETLLKDLSSLQNLRELQLLNIDNTLITKDQVHTLIEENGDLVAIFQSTPLIDWWNSLEKDWKDALALTEVNSHFLHALTQQRELQLRNYPITSLAPLEPFMNLQKLTIDNTRITNLSELLDKKELIELTISNGPLQSIEGISKLSSLVSLSIKNSAVETLKPLEGLKGIKMLNCSGTNIKNLKGIDSLYELEFLDMSNTRVWKLQRLYGKNELKKVVCFNTRLRDHTVEDFQKAMPSCEVDFY